MRFNCSGCNFLPEAPSYKYCVTLLIICHVIPCIYLVYGPCIVHPTYGQSRLLPCMLLMNVCPLHVSLYIFVILQMPILRVLAAFNVSDIEWESASVTDDHIYFTPLWLLISIYSLYTRGSLIQLFVSSLFFDPGLSSFVITQK